jgi:hypothetical protein
LGRSVEEEFPPAAAGMFGVSEHLATSRKEARGAIGA